MLVRGTEEAILRDEPIKERPQAGQLVIVRFLNAHRDDDGKEASALVPKLAAFVMGGAEMPIPKLEAAAAALALGERADLDIPAGSEVSLPSSRVAGVPEFFATAPLAVKVCAELELQSCALQVTKSGLGDGEQPREGHLVVVRTRNTRLWTGAPFSMPELVKFVIGSEDVIPGLDAAVARMTLNEHATVTIPPIGAYGAAGSPGVIPPDATLLMDLELLGWS